jgi:hypothetical protein
LLPSPAPCCPPPGRRLPRDCGRRRRHTRICQRSATVDLLQLFIAYLESLDNVEVQLASGFLADAGC